MSTGPTSRDTAGEIAPTSFRTDQAQQFDVDWRDFIAAKYPHNGGPVYQNPPKKGTQTMQSGPMSGEDIFSDRRAEGRRVNGR